MWHWGHIWSFLRTVGFPGSSVGKESTCNAGDLGLIPGLGRSAGEWIGYPLQCSWASPVAQLVKNPPAMWETWVWSLGWEDPLKVEMVTHSSILAGESHGQRSLAGYSPWSLKVSETTEWLSLSFLERQKGAFNHIFGEFFFNVTFWGKDLVIFSLLLCMPISDRQ